MLESCQRAETLLHDVQQLACDPRAETLARCETHLSQIETLLTSLHESMAQEGGRLENAAGRRVLEEIRRMGTGLKAQFEHGSNYCMGLLQISLGTGYSEQGSPVLIPSVPKSSFEG